MKQARSFHRRLGSILAVFLLYIAATGTLTQLIDLKAILSHAPADDPEMIAIRESLDGASNFAVIDTPDYTARPIAPEFDLTGGISHVAAAAKAHLGSEAPLQYVELRQASARTVGLVESGERISLIDASDGALLAPPALRPFKPNPPSWHLWFKNWHRLFAFGDGILLLNSLVGIGLGAMTLLGLALYVQLYRARRRTGRQRPFWSAGGWIRTGHRSVALVASAWIMIVAVSGTLLSLDSLHLEIYRVVHPDRLVGGFIPQGMVRDYSSPLDLALLPGMTARVLQAFRTGEPGTPIKVLRLRTFAGMPQGVIVTGGAKTRQLVFNANTGAQVSTGEPSYPETGFLLNWKWHERLKQIHRGDFIGLPGRLLDLFSGLAIMFLSASALTMLRRPRPATRRPTVKKHNG